MTADWTRLATFELEHDLVQARWLPLLDRIPAAIAELRLQAQGNWTILPGIDAECGPEGIAALPLVDEELEIPDCRPGCLIGRLGEPLPNASEEDEPLVFPIGADGLVDLPPDLHGPLFIGFNVVARPVTVKWLRVILTGARLS